MIKYELKNTKTKQKVLGNYKIVLYEKNVSF
jgi:hypothetical protein